MYLVFSALKEDVQVQIKNLVASLSGEFQYDLRFNIDGAYITSVPKGYTNAELWFWAHGTKYYELSNTHKCLVLEAIQRALPSNDYVATIYGGEGLYNVSTSENPNPSHLWDESRTASEWLVVLGLDGPIAPSGDSCLDLELSALSIDPNNWEQRFKALEKDMEGMQNMVNKLRAILA